MKEESEKAGLKLSIQKIKIMASGPITLWQIEGRKVEAVTDFTFLGSKITADGECSHEINPRASSAKTRGFHTQLDEGPETPRATREASGVPFLRQDEA